MMAENNSERFYGWNLVALTFYSQFIVMGTVFYSYGILFKPILEDIGGSRLDFGMAFPVFQIVSGLTGLLLGQIMTRVSIRKVMLTGTFVLSAGFFLLARTDSLLWFYLSFGFVIGAGHVMVGGITNTALVSNWFNRKRGTALGFSQFGVSASGMVMAFVTPWMIGMFGWRRTVEIFALLPVFLIAPAFWRWVVDKPEDKGMRPDGLLPSGTTVSSEPAIINNEQVLSNHEALKSANFWLILLSMGFCFCVIGAVLVRIFAHVTDQGYSIAEASLVVSVMSGFAACGKPLFGWLADKLGVKVAFTFSILLQIAGLILIITAQSHSVLLLSAFAFGLGYGGLLPVWGVLIGTAFGRHSFAKVMGLMTPIMLPFQTLSVPLSDWVFDRTGTYNSAFMMLTSLYLAALATLIFIRLNRNTKRASA